MIKKDPNLIDQILAERRALGISQQPLKRPRAIRFPKRFERLYQQLLLENVSRWEEETREKVFPLLPSWVADQDSVTGRTDSWSDQVNNVVTNLEFPLFPSDADFEDSTLSFGQQTADWHDNEWRKVLKRTVGVDIFKSEPWLPDLLVSWANTNVGLIKKVGDDVRSDVLRVVNDGIQAGKRVETIQKELMGTGLDSGVFKTARYRAQLIARDQIGKLNSKLTENRQTQLGIEHYIWRTALDERVRGNPSGAYPSAIPSHWDREGKRFSWEKPPAGGHPGTAIQCRCTAEPDFDELESEIVDKPGDPATGGIPREIPPPPETPSERRRRTRKKPTGITAALQIQEDLRRKDRYEYVAGFDKRGNRLFENTAKKTNAAPLYRRDYEALRKTRGTITHNHPRSTAFSPADIAVTLQSHASSMRVGARSADYLFRSFKTNTPEQLASDYRLLFRMSARGKITPSPALKAIEREVEREALDLIKRGTLTTGRADFEHWHKIWEKVINEKRIKLSGKYRYERTLRGK